MTHDVYTLPPGLPAPEDDGACDHLRGLDLPPLTLESSRGPIDLSALAAGLLVLYEAFRSGRPIETEDKDRARMGKLAGAYRATGGPSMALVDTWLAAAKK